MKILSYLNPIFAMSAHPETLTEEGQKQPLLNILLFII